jgi:hypothetical protein
MVVEIQTSVSQRAEPLSLIPQRSFPHTVSHCVGLRVYDPGSIPSSLTHRLVRTGPSAHNISRRRYRSQFP